MTSIWGPAQDLCDRSHKVGVNTGAGTVCKQKTFGASVEPLCIIRVDIGEGLRDRSNFIKLGLADR